MANVDALWYVIHTYSGYENKVAANIQRMVETRGLENLIFETRIPTEVLVDSEEEADEYLKNEAGNSSEEDGETAKKEKVKKPTEHKLFPSYVLVKMVMNDETWHIVRNIRGVTGFVGPGSKPVPLTEKEVEALGVDEVRVRETAFAKGDNVMVVAGFIAGAVGIVEEIDETHGRVKITANIGGKEQSVELDISEVEPLRS